MSVLQENLCYVNEHPRKIDIWQIPEMVEVLRKFETADIRKLAIAGLERAPLQFWIMPASMSKAVHHSTEHSIGEVIYDDKTGLNRVTKIGGKAFHTVRVVNYAEVMLEADHPPIQNFQGKIIEIKRGNELTVRERDLIRTACLWHDVFSGGTNDEFNPKRRGMDKYHPHYHATEFAYLANIIPTNEWELLVKIIKHHMWKWDDYVDIVKFHDMKECSSVEEAYQFMRRYRLIRIVELSDLLASKNL